MNAEQMYTLMKLRAVDVEEQARQARLVSGRRPEPVARAVRTRLRRVAERLRITRPSLPRTDASMPSPAAERRRRPAA